MDEKFTATFLAVFLTETIKNVAKGSANWLKDNGEFLFYSEITQLGLSQSATVEETALQLEAKPEMVKVIQNKVD